MGKPLIKNLSCTLVTHTYTLNIREQNETSNIVILINKRYHLQFTMIQFIQCITCILVKENDKKKKKLNIT